MRRVLENSSPARVGAAQAGTSARGCRWGHSARQSAACARGQAMRGHKQRGLHAAAGRFSWKRWAADLCTRSSLEYRGWLTRPQCCAPAHARYTLIRSRTCRNAFVCTMMGHPQKSFPRTTPSEASAMHLMTALASAWSALGKAGWRAVLVCAESVLIRQLRACCARRCTCRLACRCACRQRGCPDSTRASTCTRNGWHDEEQERGAALAVCASCANRGRTTKRLTALSLGTRTPEASQRTCAARARDHTAVCMCEPYFWQGLGCCMCGAPARGGRMLCACGRWCGPFSMFHREQRANT